MDKKKGIIIKMALATQITTQHFSFTLAVAVTGAQVTHYIFKSHAISLPCVLPGDCTNSHTGHSAWSLDLKDVSHLV